MKFKDLAEHQIRKAQSEGQLDNLKGAGKPLPAAGDGDFAASAGFRIMAEAGALPKEIELKKAADQQRKLLQETVGHEARKVEMAKLADLELRLAIETEARRKYYSTN